MKTTSNFFRRGLSAIPALALYAVSALSFAQPAAATEPTPPPTQCGTVCPGTTVWDITASGVFGGMGAGVFEGTDTGTVDITKSGGSNLDLVMNGEGCGTLDCTNGASSFTFTGRTFEDVHVDVTATGGAEGVPVLVENGGAAAVGMMLQIRRLQGSPVTPGN